MEYICLRKHFSSMIKAICSCQQCKIKLLLGNTMLQKPSGHWAHPSFMAEQREREEAARQWREDRAALVTSTWRRRRSPSVSLLENQMLLWEYGRLRSISPAPPLASFSSIFFLCRVLLLSPDGQKLMTSFPFGKSWKHQRFCKRRPGTADSLAPCLVVYFQQSWSPFGVCADSIQVEYHSG